MDSARLKIAIKNALGDLVDYENELRDLDAALGDGDLGITVAAGSRAVIDALDGLPETATPTDIARTCAATFADANPSTMAALVAGGLLAGSKTWEGKDTISVADAALFVQAAADSIAKRGRSQVGDKTILDAIYPAAEALGDAASVDDALPSAVAAAEKAVQDTKSMQSMRGRASWLQERSIGLQDPGATAFWYLLRSWQKTNAN
ncbi:dihydroxyacetone kinase subunit DhaL [Pontimonas salivibrio]|uniref:Dihydroxyacetone kinase subunit DhaL n=1 Tax=Pontimonas salivibrio TaxID=1159327 RepID=A0A2L2BRA4_9MICO|nr:DAK2 domain-containing protein [Pontimonas salivibrio]AVG24204.1 dihydroxyacetone kinase subunit DhaL [Pontimonas salivibrio]